MHSEMLHNLTPTCAPPLQAIFEAQPTDSELRAAVATILDVPSAAVQREEAAILLGKKLLVRLVEGAGSKLHATAYAGALAALQRAGLQRLPVELTALYISMSDDRKFARDIGAFLS